MAWGTVPDWLAAVGTVCAFVALFYQVRKDRSERKAAAIQEQKQAAEEQVRRVTGWAVYDNEVTSNYADIIATISNASEMAIYNVEVQAIDPMLDRPPSRVAVLAPNSSCERSFLAVEVDTQQSTPRISITFTDAGGRRWLRDGSRFKPIDVSADL